MVAQLPLSGRNWDDLIALVPGVQADRYTEEGGGTANGRTGGANVHGVRSLQNNYVLDGVDNNSISENVQELTTQVARPSVDSIQEFKVSTNPYSAENEYMGWNGIEIFTQPGSEKWHGNLGFNFADESLNSRNPFAFRRAPFQQRAFNGSLSGPIVKKRASFNLYAGRYASETNSVVNATTLDPLTLVPFRFNQTFVPPQRSEYVSARVDVKLNKKHTLVGSYDFGEGAQRLQGIGGFSLPSRAFSSRRQNHNFQLVETALINEKTVNEMRFQFSHSIFRQTANTALPALNVIDSFFGGGAQIGTASNQQDRADLQNFTSWQAGKHFIKIGERLRYVRIRSISPGNFGGTYTFAGGVGPALDRNENVVPGGGTIQVNSLEQYRRTLLFQRQGLSAAQIRSLGGGATQFSIAGGNPEARVAQADISVYVQDEWKLRPNLEIAMGLRYYLQNNPNVYSGATPRLGVAWTPDKKAKWQLHGHLGLFTGQFGTDDFQELMRMDGVNRVTSTVYNPVYGNPLGNDAAVIHSIRTTAPHLSNISFSIENIGGSHEFPHGWSISADYYTARIWNYSRSHNINSPLNNSPTGPRPGPANLNVLQLNNSGQGGGNVEFIGINQHAYKKVQFFFGAVRVNVRDDTDDGEFFTPPSIVQTLVNVIEPSHGVVFDPACGSGGMFVQSARGHQRK